MGRKGKKKYKEFMRVVPDNLENRVLFAALFGPNWAVRGLGVSESEVSEAYGDRYFSHGNKGNVRATENHRFQKN